MSDASGPGEKVGGMRVGVVSVGGVGGRGHVVRSRMSLCGGMMVRLPIRGTTR